MLLFPYEPIVNLSGTFVIHPRITVARGMHVHITRCVGNTVCNK